MRQVAAASLILMLVAVPAAAQVTDHDLGDARAELAVVQAEVDALTARLFEAVHDNEELEDQLSYLDVLLIEGETDVADTREDVRRRAVEMYMEASGGSFEQIIFSDSPVEFGARLGYLSELGTDDQALLRDLEAARIEFDRQLALLEVVQSEQEAVVAELDSLTTQLMSRLQDAQTRYADLVLQKQEEERLRRLEEERLRREAEQREREAAATSTTNAIPDDSGDETTTTTTTPPAPVDGLYCPISGFTSFSDTWGAGRSGGRSHEGVDMLAARGTPVVAVESGVVTRKRTSRLGGITVWLRGSGGDQYYYAHLDSWAPGLTEGQNVDGGDPLGTVGTTGNAPASLPHLHFEFHPGGGRAVNPTPLATSLCK